MEILLEGDGTIMAGPGKKSEGLHGQPIILRVDLRLQLAACCWFSVQSAPNSDLW